MFAVIVSGRLVQTDFQRVGETQFITTILDADSINHIVVFLTGIEPFPDGVGGLVYFSLPDSNAPVTWQLLGYISNDKPSETFNVSNLKKDSSASSLIFGMPKISHNAQIGISLEAMLNVQQQVAALANETMTTHLDFEQKMLENFFNYISSFSLTQAQMVPNPSETYIPVSAVQNWYTTFKRRLQQNFNFWKS